MASVWAPTTALAPSLNHTSPANTKSSSSNGSGGSETSIEAAIDVLYAGADSATRLRRAAAHALLRARDGPAGHLSLTLPRVSEVLRMSEPEAMDELPKRTKVLHVLQGAPYLSIASGLEHVVALDLLGLLRDRNLLHLLPTELQGTLAEAEAEEHTRYGRGSRSGHYVEEEEQAPAGPDTPPQDFGDRSGSGAAASGGQGQQQRQQQQPLAELLEAAFPGQSHGAVLARAAATLLAAAPDGPVGRNSMMVARLSELLHARVPEAAAACRPISGTLRQARHFTIYPISGAHGHSNDAVKLNLSMIHYTYGDPHRQPPRQPTTAAEGASGASRLAAPGVSPEALQAAFPGAGAEACVQRAAARMLAAVPAGGDAPAGRHSVLLAKLCHALRNVEPAACNACNPSQAIRGAAPFFKTVPIYSENGHSNYAVMLDVDRVFAAAGQDAAAAGTGHGDGYQETFDDGGWVSGRTVGHVQEGQGGGGGYLTVQCLRIEWPLPPPSADLRAALDEVLPIEGARDPGAVGVARAAARILLARKRQLGRPLEQHVMWTHQVGQVLNRLRIRRAGSLKAAIQAGCPASPGAPPVFAFRSVRSDTLIELLSPRLLALAAPPLPAGASDPLLFGAGFGEQGDEDPYSATATAGGGRDRAYWDDDGDSGGVGGGAGASFAPPADGVGFEAFGDELVSGWCEELEEVLFRVLPGAGVEADAKRAMVRLLAAERPEKPRKRFNGTTVAPHTLSFHELGRALPTRAGVVCNRHLRHLAREEPEVFALDEDCTLVHVGLMQAAAAAVAAAARRRAEAATGDGRAIADLAAEYNGGHMDESAAIEMALRRSQQEAEPGRALVSEGERRQQQAAPAVAPQAAPPVVSVPMPVPMPLPVPVAVPVAGAAATAPASAAASRQLPLGLALVMGGADGLPAPRRLVLAPSAAARPAGSLPAVPLAGQQQQQPQHGQMLPPLQQQHKPALQPTLQLPAQQQQQPMPMPQPVPQPMPMPVPQPVPLPVPVPEPDQGLAQLSSAVPHTLLPAWYFGDHHIPMLQHCYSCPHIGIAAKTAGSRTAVLTLYAPAVPALQAGGPLGPASAPAHPGWPATTYVLDLIPEDELSALPAGAYGGQAQLIGELMGLMEHGGVAKVVHGAKQVVAALRGVLGPGARVGPVRDTLLLTHMLDAAAAACGGAGGPGADPTAGIGDGGSEGVPSLASIPARVAGLKQRLAALGAWAGAGLGQQLQQEVLGALGRKQWDWLAAQAQAAAGSDSSWLARPLSGSQLAVAAQAAQHLPELWRMLYDAVPGVALAAGQRIADEAR